jgi:hypothetical protein
MREVEKAFSPVEEELKKALDQWSSAKIVVLLNIQDGKVRGLELKGPRGRGGKKADLERIFQKIVFPRAVKGPMELEFVCV